MYLVSLLVVVVYGYVRECARGVPGACLALSCSSSGARLEAPPQGLNTRRDECSGPHRLSAIAAKHPHSFTKQDISLRIHVCVTRSLVKAIMADTQPFNSR